MGDWIEGEMLRQVGARMREARRKLGMGYLMLSVFTDVPEATLAELERGRTCVSVNDLVRIARALDTTLMSLFPEGPDTPDA